MIFNRAKNLGKYTEQHFYFSKDKLYDLYWNKRLTIKEIAEKLCCGFGTVQRALVQHRISTRDFHFKKNDPRITGKNNPNFGGLSDETKAKLRTAALKLERIRASIKNLPKDIWGENNGNWRGGKSFEPYPIDFNHALKRQIRARDDYKCQECGVEEAELDALLSVHHIDYDKENNDPINLISLCIRCHINTNFNRAYWTSHLRAKLNN